MQKQKFPYMKKQNLLKKILLNQKTTQNLYILIIIHVQQIFENHKKGFYLYIER